MHVKTKLLESNIEGIGIFADEYIPKGTVIWKFTPGFDIKLTKKDIVHLPTEAIRFLDKYAYLSKKSKMYILPIDNGRFFNHSNTPNCNSIYSEDEEEVVTYAIKDIQIGEEITDDYRTFEESSDISFDR